MSTKSPGPFKRSSSKKPPNFSIHAPWAGAALALIALTQFPIAIKASLDLVCISKTRVSSSGEVSCCKKF
tara:strand:+ start:706 stop:915 length:210 start_codon:yes stop_codon:yes gene_type:complete